MKREGEITRECINADNQLVNRPTLIICRGTQKQDMWIIVNAARMGKQYPGIKDRLHATPDPDPIQDQPDGR